MLPVTELAELIDQATYRPGWTFTMHDHIEGPQLRIECALEDSHEPGTNVDLRIDTFIPPIPDPGYFQEWLLWRLKRIEIHEACEWLRFNDELVHDPHA